MECDASSLEAYKGLSEGRVYNTMSELNVNQFFTDAVHTVGKLFEYHQLPTPHSSVSPTTLNVNFFLQNKGS